MAPHVGPLAGEFARGMPLRGLWFSLPLRGLDENAGRHWLAELAWEGVLGDKAARHRRLGWSATRAGYVLMLGLVAALSA